MRVSRPSSRLSFDDLIELRFLPSRRRRRDPEYFEQLKSMIMPREVNHRVSLEDRRAALLALTVSASRSGEGHPRIRLLPCALSRHSPGKLAGMFIGVPESATFGGRILRRSPPRVAVEADFLTETMNSKTMKPTTVRTKATMTANGQ